MKKSKSKNSKDNSSNNHNNSEIIKLKKYNPIKEGETKDKFSVKKLPTKILDEKFSKNNIIIAIRVRPLNKKELDNV